MEYRSAKHTSNERAGSSFFLIVDIVWSPPQIIRTFAMEEKNADAVLVCSYRTNIIRSETSLSVSSCAISWICLIIRSTCGNTLLETRTMFLLPAKRPATRVYPKLTGTLPGAIWKRIPRPRRILVSVNSVLSRFRFALRQKKAKVMTSGYKRLSRSLRSETESAFRNSRTADEKGSSVCFCMKWSQSTDFGNNNL